MTATHSVAANFASLIAGEAVARVLGLTALLYLARRIGVDGFGRLELALAVLAYVQLVVDAGLDTVATRRVAASPERRTEFAEQLIGLRLLLGSLALAALWAVGHAVHLDRDRHALLMAFAVSVIPSACAVGWAFQAASRMRAVAVAAVVTQAVYLGLLLFFVRSATDLDWVPRAYGVGVAAGIAATGAWYVRRYGRFRPRLAWRFARDTMREALPIAASRGLRAVSFNFDLLFLGWIGSATIVGYYAAAYRVVLVPLLGFATFFTALFPELVRMPEARRRSMLTRLLTGVSLVSIGFAFGLVFAASPLLRLTMGDAYLPAADSLRLLAWTIPVVAVGGVFRQLLLARHRQTLDLLAVALGAALNVSLNLALVPRYGVTGAAVATLAGEATVLVAAAIAVWRATEPRPSPGVGDAVSAGARA